jgi:hypothetical protein
MRDHCVGAMRRAERAKEIQAHQPRALPWALRFRGISRAEPVACHLAAAAAIFLLAVVPLDGQSMRTPWGDPDLQGTWTNQTLTPLERPAEFAGKPVLTQAEATAYEARLRLQNNADIRTPGTRRDLGVAYNDVWWDRGDSIVADRRTSLIVDPADGRIPPVTPAAEARAAANRKRNAALGDNPESWEDVDVYSRCIIRSALPRLSTGYNNNYEIVQTPGYVAILQEQIHDTRIILLDGRPHLSGTVRQWLGDSRGRWEGDTLVVETTNFTDEARGSTFRDATKNMVLVERFRRIDANTIDYQFTVTDPETWTRPWTAKMPWNKVDGLMYEYACHEGNYGLANTLRSARVAEKAAQQQK